VTQLGAKQQKAFCEKRIYNNGNKRVTDCQKQCVNTKTNCPCAQLCGVYKDENGIADGSPTGCTYSEPLTISIAFRYSCGFQDRNDIRCKYGNLPPTMGTLRPEAECQQFWDGSKNGQSPGEKHTGPCLRCVTPEFEIAEAIPLRIALNSIDFTNPVNFITYGTAVKLDAALLDEGSGRRRFTTVLKAEARSGLPRVIIAAQDVAGNTALEDFNKDVKVSIRIVKGGKKGAVGSQEFKPDKGVGQEWFGITEVQLKSAEVQKAAATSSQPAEVGLIKPLAGQYRIEFVAVDPAGGDKCKVFSDSTEKVWNKIGKIENLDVPNGCLTPSLNQVSVEVKDGDIFINNSKIEAIFGAETLREALISGATCNEGQDEETFLKSIYALRGKPEEYVNDTRYKVDPKTGKVMPIPLTKRTVQECWNVVDPQLQFHFTIRTMDVAQNYRTENPAQDQARTTLYRSEAWCAAQEGKDLKEKSTKKTYANFNRAAQKSKAVPSGTGFPGAGAVYKNDGPDTKEECMVLESYKTRNDCICPTAAKVATDLECAQVHMDFENKRDLFVWTYNTNECWRKLSKAQRIEAKDRGDGTYEARMSVDVAGSVAYEPDVDYMGSFNVDVEIAQTTEDKNGTETTRWVHIPQSPINTEMISIACTVGSEQNSDGDNCWCVAGWMTKTTGGCQRCPEGFFKEQWMVPLELSCLPCPAREDTNGTVGATSKSQCVCQPGYYDPRIPYTTNDSVAIRKQKQYPFTSAGIGGRDVPWIPTAQELKDIEQGKARPNSELEILKCFENSYDEASWQHDFQDINYLKFRCQRCPDGMDQCDANDPNACDAPGPKAGCAICSGNETIGVKKSWWAETRDVPPQFHKWGPATVTHIKEFTDPALRQWERTALHVETTRTSRRIFICPEGEKTGACLGGENAQACKLGHQLIACASCAKGFAPNSDKQCDSCGDEKVAEKMGVVLLGAMAAAFGFYLSIKFVTPEIAVKCKILISMGQVLGGFKETYQIKWPPFMKKLLEEFKIFNFDMFSFGNMGCQVPELKNFYYKFGMTVFMPAFLIGIVLAGFLIRKVVLKGKRMADKEAHARLVHILEDMNFRGACFSKAFFVLILMYLRTSATILMMFNCRVFEPLPDGSPVRLLEADYDRDCETEGHTQMVGVGIIFVMIYPLGVPGLFCILLFKNRETINDSINIQKYGFIFKDYGPVFFWWEIWDLVRKLTMSGLLIFFDKGSADQLSLAILFSTISLVLHTRMFPYSDMASNWIQLAVLGSLQLTLFGSLVLKMESQESTMDSDMVDIYLAIINFGIPCGLVTIVAYEAQRAFTAKARAKLKLAKRRKRQQQLLEDSAGIDMKTIARHIEAEEQASAERKANKVGIGAKLAKGSGINMVGAASLAMTKQVAHRVNVFASKVVSAKDLFPTLAEEKLAVKKLQFDKERADEAFRQADREATDLSEWIHFARTHNASENELMSFVKAFGDELLGDIDVHEMDSLELELEAAHGGRNKRSSAVVLADNYPFIRSAAMALRRHHFG